MAEPLIFHIDVNSAFLSWEAAYRKMTQPDAVDLREIPSVIGGNEATRHGIVLAKSPSAKKYGIRTGEPLAKARQKCPNLVVAPPHYSLYVENSRRFIELLKKYAPVVEQYSIDEAFCDMTGTGKLYGDPVAFAHQLKDEIYDSFGFTVNIGISDKKLLAKMASDFEKPNKVHTLFSAEVPSKLWPLPVEELFTVGKSTAARLRILGIRTIGDLARMDPELIKAHLKKHGEVIWNYANGNDDSKVASESAASKSYGNSITIPQDVTDRETAQTILLSLCETVGARIRADKAYIGVVSVSIVDSDFHQSSIQETLDTATNVTETIYETACRLFDRLWKGAPIRLLNVSTSHPTSDSYAQVQLFGQEKLEKLTKLNSAIDQIRDRFGEDSIKRARFVKVSDPNAADAPSKLTHMTGGIGKSKRDARNQNKKNVQDAFGAQNGDTDVSDHGCR